MAAEPTAVGDGGLDRIFQFTAWDTPFSRDLIAGFTTFIAMSHITRTSWALEGRACPSPRR